MKIDARIDYIELPANDIAAVQAFYGRVFGWEFESYGPDYLAFKESRLDGGFYRADLKSSTVSGAALVVFYTKDLEVLRDSIVEAGGEITQQIFDFPGGRRFHFQDPAGNELAVWSDPLVSK